MIYSGNLERLGGVKLNAKQILVAGSAQGAVLGTQVPLSFWGGVNPETGVIIDQHHELCGQTITDRVFVLPSGRGSCTGSVVLMECLLLHHAPSAILLREVDEIISLGVILAEELFSRSIPVFVLHEDDHDKAMSAQSLQVWDDGRCVVLGREPNNQHSDELLQQGGD